MQSRRRSFQLVLMAVLASAMTWTFVAARAAESAKIVLNQDEFRDRVYACWLGKNIGGTLGMPVEGQPGPHKLTFYTNVSAGEPAANDDLDLQLLWLKALEENGGRVDARTLGVYWLKYVIVDWNEYGVGQRNMRRGLLPPVSGQFENARWIHSNGAWCRTEIWAVVAPGCPGLAARMAWEDACVDHGAGEGTWAAVFLTAVESAAFVQRDRDTLIAVGLSMIPPDSRIARAIRTAMAAHRAGKNWSTARQEVIDATRDTGWFQSPRDLAFTMLAWLYGEGDFEKSLCLAVNCGDDTDTSGAAMGSLLGILNGTAGIPRKWRAPIGTKIKNVAIGGFDPPRQIGEFTDRTVSMTRRVLALHGSPVALTAGPTDLRGAHDAVRADPATADALRRRSPYQVVFSAPHVCATLDYIEDPWITGGRPRPVRLLLRNPDGAEKAYGVALGGLPKGWRVEGLPPAQVVVPGGASQTIAFTLHGPADDVDDVKMTLTVGGRDGTVEMPLALIAKSNVGSDDLALASKGAVARADSEYALERPCAAKVIDGILATPEDFSNRWHSSLTAPHPHWIEVRLPKPERIGRIVIRFADPAGKPLDFHGLVRPAGSSDWQEVFRVKGNLDSRSYRTRIPSVVTDTFRLVIDKSINPVSANAAQISEIELYPAKGSP